MVSMITISCDYLLWRYLKSKVSETRPATIQDFKVQNEEEVCSITPYNYLNLKAVMITPYREVSVRISI